MLFGIAADAQTLVDAARKERERRAQLKNVHVYTNDEARAASSSISQSSGAAAAPVEKQSAEKPAEAPKAATAPAQPKPSDDPVLKWNEEVAKLRSKIRQLQDEETALRLQLNQANNQFFAPVTDEATRAQAQARIADIQSKLAATRQDMDETRKKLQAMEAQGPPKKP